MNINVVVVSLVTLAMPYLPSSELFGFFTSPPVRLSIVPVGLTGLYVVAAEIAKK